MQIYVLNINTYNSFRCAGGFVRWVLGGVLWVVFLWVYGRVGAAFPGNPNPWQSMQLP